MPIALIWCYTLSARQTGQSASPNPYFLISQSRLAAINSVELTDMGGTQMQIKG